MSTFEIPSSIMAVVHASPGSDEKPIIGLAQKKLAKPVKAKKSMKAIKKKKITLNDLRAAAGGSTASLHKSFFADDLRQIQEKEKARKPQVGKSMLRMAKLRKLAQFAEKPAGGKPASLAERTVFLVGVVFVMIDQYTFCLMVHSHFWL